MTTHNQTSTHSTPGEHARAAAREGANIRDRVRKAAADAFRGKGLTFRHLNQVVAEVLDEVSEEVRSAIPEDRRNKLRQVFDGLGDAVSSAAAAGQKAVRDTRAHASKLVAEDAPAAGRRIREANDQFLDAVGGFASRAAGEIGSELDDLVRSARRAGPRVMDGVQAAARAASESRVTELAGETAKAGARFARRAAHDIAMAAGGLMEGLADAITPPQRKAPTSRTASRPKTPRSPRATKGKRPPVKASRKAAKPPTRKKTAARTSSRRKKARSR